VKSCKETVRKHQQLIWMRLNACKPTLPNMARVQKIPRCIIQNLYLSDLKIMTIIIGFIMIIIIIFATAINKNLTRPKFDIMTICVGLQHARQLIKLNLYVKIYLHYYNLTTQRAGVSSVPFVCLSHLKSFITTWRHNERTVPIRFRHPELFPGVDDTLI